MIGLVLMLVLMLCTVLRKDSGLPRTPRLAWHVAVTQAGRLPLAGSTPALGTHTGGPMRQSKGLGPNMGAQHKRNGRKGREERQKRAAERAAKKEKQG